MDVANTGGRKSDEVVQLYIHDPVGSISQPVRRLRGFQRVTLPSGDQPTVSFTPDNSDFGFYDNRGKFVVEPGALTSTPVTAPTPTFSSHSRSSADPKLGSCLRTRLSASSRRAGKGSLESATSTASGGGVRRPVKPPTRADLHSGTSGDWYTYYCVGQTAKVTAAVGGSQ